MNFLTEPFSTLLLLLTINYSRICVAPIKTNGPFVSEKLLYQKPRCIAKLTNFECECSDGMLWNGVQCVSTQLYGYLEFGSDNRNIKYVFLEKTFPAMNEFTIAFWIHLVLNEATAKIPRTIFSYSLDQNMNAVELKANILDTNSLQKSIEFELVILGDFCKISVDSLLNNSTWFHLKITWTSEDGQLDIIVNGHISTKCEGTAEGRVLEKAGTLTLGQPDVLKNDDFEKQAPIIDKLHNFNIWDYKLNERLFNDCMLVFVGNVVQWADFQLSPNDVDVVITKWSLELGWTCLETEERSSSCNNHCIGEKQSGCQNEISNNLIWITSNTGKRVQTECSKPNKQMKRFAYRDCTLDPGDMKFGIWSMPIMSDCVQQPIQLLTNEINEFHWMDNTNEHRIVAYTMSLHNLSSFEVNKSIHDLSAIIGMLNVLVESQHEVVRKTLQVYQYIPTNDEEKMNQNFKLLISIIDKLLDWDVDTWNMSLPIGSESYRLIKLIKKINLCIFEFQKLSHLKKLKTYKSLDFQFKNIAYRQFFYNSNLTYPRELKNPGKKVQLLQDGFKSRYYAQVIFDEYFIPAKSDYYGMVIVQFSKLDKLLPKYNNQWHPNSERINSIVLHVDLIRNGISATLDNERPSALTTSFLISFNNMNAFNVSNTKCVRIHDGSDNRDIAYQWRADSCILKKQDKNSALCECMQTGTYTITNEFQTFKIQELASVQHAYVLPFISCIFAGLCSLSTFIGLIYFRTNTKIAIIHKHFSIAVFMSQLFYMLSLMNNHYNRTICGTFALLNQYSLYSVFAWLFNDFLDFYSKIVVASTRHRNWKELSKCQHCIIGWIVPFIFTAILFASKSNSYFSNKLCWFDMDHLLLFLSPLIFILFANFVFLLMLLNFVKTAKKYFSSRALAIQKMPVSKVRCFSICMQHALAFATWAFAFASFKAQNYIQLYQNIHAILNCIQASLFFIFNFYLDDEIASAFALKLCKTNTEKCYHVDSSLNGHKKPVMQTLNKKINEETLESNENLIESQSRLKRTLTLDLDLDLDTIYADSKKECKSTKRVQISPVVLKTNIPHTTSFLTNDEMKVTHL